MAASRIGAYQRRNKDNPEKAARLALLIERYGYEYEPFVDADEAREAVKRMLALGLTMKQVSALAECNLKHLYRVLDGSINRVRWEYAERIYAAEGWAEMEHAHDGA